MRKYPMNIVNNISVQLTLLGHCLIYVSVYVCFQEISTASAVDVDGGWASWSAWETKTINYYNLRESTRSRDCTNPAPKGKGRTCRGSPKQEMDQSPQECTETIGSWGEWGTWSNCSRSCGSGSIYRYKYCNTNSLIMFAGCVNCPGDSPKESESCHLESCPMPWYFWLVCGLGIFIILSILLIWLICTKCKRKKKSTPPPPPPKAKKPVKKPVVKQYEMGKTTEPEPEAVPEVDENEEAENMILALTRGFQRKFYKLKETPEQETQFRVERSSKDSNVSSSITMSSSKKGTEK